MSEKLKPCPFCGASPTPMFERLGNDRLPDYFYGHDGEWIISCGGPTVDLPHRPIWVHDVDKSVAINAWNSRPIEDALKTSLKLVTGGYQNMVALHHSDPKATNDAIEQARKLMEENHE